MTILLVMQYSQCVYTNACYILVYLLIDLFIAFAFVLTFVLLTFLNDVRS